MKRSPCSRRFLETAYEQSIDVVCGAVRPRALALTLGCVAAACVDTSPPSNTNPVTGVPVVGTSIDGGVHPVTITIPLTQSTAPQQSGGAPSAGGAGGAGGGGGITGSLGGTTGTGGVGTTGGTTSTAASQQPGSAFCGDGLRNSAKEECDDGPAVMGDTGDFCSDLCQVTDSRVVVDNVADTPRATIARWLGAGRHPVAAGSNGFAVALMQEGPAVGALAIRVTRFDALGHRGGIIDASVDTLIERDADPVLAIAPNGDMIVAYTDFDGDGDAKGIAVRLVRAGKISPEKAIYPAQNYFGSQYAPDILALSDRLVVAWTDESSAQTGPDIRYRELSFDLKPMGDEKTLSATAIPEGRVSLSVLGTSWGAAWRAGNGDGWETTEVFDAGHNLRWSASAHLPAEADDIPALLPVDDTHHALVFTEGTDFDAGDVYVDELYVVPLDTNAPGSVTAVPLPVTSAYSGWAGLSRRRPAIVRTQSDAWLAWWSGAPLGSAGGEDVWLEKLTASIAGSNLSVTLNGELSLPRWKTEDGADQRFPALALMSPSDANSLGTMFAVWDDYSGAMTGESHPDVLAQLSPLPMLRQGALATHCTPSAPCTAGKGPCTIHTDGKSDCAPDNPALVCNPNVGPQFGYNIGMGVCVKAHCANNLKDQDETGTDCGGVDCGTCTCPDGIFSPMLGEVCDEGRQTVSCETNCQVPYCGDKITNSLRGEACDDGTALNGTVNSRCKADCQANICPDGVQGLGEVCDDGAQTVNCETNCKRPRCGDQIINPLIGETCDDGDAVNGTINSRCKADCHANVCGDGVQGLGEQCDDGNSIDTDGCKNDCKRPAPAVCGNGITEYPEPCDDGNQSNTDICTYGCKAPFCGDKFVWAGHEDCEPLLDPSCSSTCTATKGCQTSGSCLSAWALTRDTVNDTQISLTLRIRNNGTTSVSLANVKLRYWFSKEPGSTLSTACDFATMSCGKIGQALSTVSPAKRGATTLLEMTFTNTPPTLAPGADSGDIQVRVTNSGGTNFAEADDFSYPASTTLIADTNIALYVSNVLKWGNEPHSVPYCGDGIKDPNEDCDTTVESPTCNANCTTRRCGDGIRNVAAGELCDTGGNSTSCDSDCTVPACNDGIWNRQFGEICDPSVVSGCKSDCSGWLTAGTACTNTAICLYASHQEPSSDSLTDNQLRPFMRIVNNGNAPVTMRDIVLRYWFTGDTGTQTYVESCDFFDVISTDTTNQCSVVTQSVVTVSPAKNQADHYWELHFNSDAQLAVGASTGDIQVRANKTGWNPFSETNDWSQSRATSLTPTTHVTLYVKGVQAWGEEPH